MLRARACRPPPRPARAPRQAAPCARLHIRTPQVRAPVLRKPSPTISSYYSTSSDNNGEKKSGFTLSSLTKKETWKNWWEIAKTEGRHYKHGTVVFWNNLKSAKKILSDKVVKKKRLTRSERVHLNRTAFDFLKLGNLIPILVIPAAEFALPVILKLFPGFLPSTYATSEQVQGKLNASIQQKSEIISALQGSTEDMFRRIRFESLGLKDDDAAAAWQRMRSGEIPLDTQEILHFAQLFHELFALDKLPRRKLEKVCQFFSLPSKGSDEFLINCIRIKMRMLRDDDEEILEEGIYNLSDIDLREANIDRGVKGVKLEREQLTKLLREWIELSSHALPPYLLVLSRSFTMSDHVNAKIAELEKLEKRIEKLEKISPKSAETAKAQEKLEEAKQDVQRILEKEAAKPAPAPHAAAASTTGELKEKILEVASNLATAEKEVSKQGSTLLSDTAELVSKQIEAMINELEKDAKLDQHKKDKIWLLQQFASYDKDRNGSITATELKEVLAKLGERLSDEDVKALIVKVDQNKDMQISFEEFQKVFEWIPKLKAAEKAEKAAEKAAAEKAAAEKAAADKSADKSAEKTAEKTAEKVAEKPAEKPEAGKK